MSFKSQVSTSRENTQQQQQQSQSKNDFKETDRSLSLTKISFARTDSVKTVGRNGDVIDKRKGALSPNAIKTFDFSIDMPSPALALSSYPRPLLATTSSFVTKMPSTAASDKHQRPTMEDEEEQQQQQQQQQQRQQRRRTTKGSSLKPLGGNNFEAQQDPEDPFRKPHSSLKSRFGSKCYNISKKTCKYTKTVTKTFSFGFCSCFKKTFANFSAMENSVDLELTERKIPHKRKTCTLMTASIAVLFLFSVLYWGYWFDSTHYSHSDKQDQLELSSSSPTIREEDNFAFLDVDIRDAVFGTYSRWKEKRRDSTASTITDDFESKKPLSSPSITTNNANAKTNLDPVTAKKIYDMLKINERAEEYETLLKSVTGLFLADFSETAGDYMSQMMVEMEELSNHEYYEPSVSATDSLFQSKKDSVTFVFDLDGLLEKHVSRLIESPEKLEKLETLLSFKFGKASGRSEKEEETEKERISTKEDGSSSRFPRSSLEDLKTNTLKRLIVESLKDALSSDAMDYRCCCRKEKKNYCKSASSSMYELTTTKMKKREENKKETDFDQRKDLNNNNNNNNDNNKQSKISYSSSFGSGGTGNNGGGAKMESCKIIKTTRQSEKDCQTSMSPSSSSLSSEEYVNNKCVPHLPVYYRDAGLMHDVTEGLPNMFYVFSDERRNDGTNEHTYVRKVHSSSELHVTLSRQLYDENTTCSLLLMMEEFDAFV